MPSVKWRQCCLSTSQRKLNFKACDEKLPEKTHLALQIPKAWLLTGNLNTYLEPVKVGNEKTKLSLKTYGYPRLTNLCISSKHFLVFMDYNILKYCLAK